jgi:hypothetical protein
MRRSRPIAGLLALAAALAAAPAASADDAGLFAAYNARQESEVDPAAEAYADAVRRARRRNTAAAWRAVIRTDRGINRVLTAIELDLTAQVASSEPGGRARTAGLREVRGWRTANRYEIRSIRALLDGRLARANELLERATRLMRRVYRRGRRAVAAFAEVGLSSPVGAVSAKSQDRVA